MNIEKLDFFEKKIYIEKINKEYSHEELIKFLFNSVEGDLSQCSEELKKELKKFLR